MAMFFGIEASAADRISNSSSSRRGTSSRANVRPSERVARASWTPKRRSKRAPAAIQRVDRDQVAPIAVVDYIEPEDSQPLRQVGRAVGSALLDPPVQLEGKISLSSMGGTPISGLPLIPAGELHGSTIACDALPGGCGCSDSTCGGCDGIGSCGSGGCSTCGELVSPEAWRPCMTLCVPQDGWVNFEYLLWWQAGMELPPLVTTSTGTGVPATQAGVLGLPSTRTLFGGNDVLTNSFDGGRLNFGVWLDKCHTWGLGAEYFSIGTEHDGFMQTSTGNPPLARPFFNTQTGLNDSELVAFPGILTGTVAVDAYSSLQGAGIHLKYLRCCDEGCGSWLFCGGCEHYCSRTEAMIGYRGLDLEEGVSVTENLTSTDQNNPGTFNILDRFETRNQFNGFDLGWTYRETRGFWTFESLLRMAIGSTRQTVRINGSTTITDPAANPATASFTGGLLTQPSNIGTYRQDEFSIVPEFGAKVGYQLTDHLKATLGYTFIYWSNVVRPGDQISLDVNPNQLPPRDTTLVGIARPRLRL